MGHFLTTSHPHHEVPTCSLFSPGPHCCRVDLTTALLWWELLQPPSPVRSPLITKLQSSWLRCVHKLRTLMSVWSNCQHSGPRLLVSSGLATTSLMLSGCVHKRDYVDLQLGTSTAKSAFKASRAQLTNSSPNHLSMEL